MYNVMKAGRSNFQKNEHKWSMDKQIETVSRENSYKLPPLLNRRSYNEYKGSETFINLLDEDTASGTPSLEQNIKSPDVVLRCGDELLHTNEEDCQCFPSKKQLQRGGKTICFKASSVDKMSVDVASQSEFASQTLKPFSAQNLEWFIFDDSRDCSKNFQNYKLKETSPGCLPSKRGKSKKLQRKNSGKMEQEFNTESPSELSNKEMNDEKFELAAESNSGPAKMRRKSFLSSVIKFAKFGRKKKRSEETQEMSDDSNWETESSEEKRESNSCEVDEFIFGGVRVFLDENGEFLEVDDEYDSRSVSTYSEDESESDGPIRRTRIKCESSDSLNLGYSGSFVT